MNENHATRRPFQFSLRTLFVVMTLWGLWLSYAVNWMHQRHDALGQDGDAYATDESQTLAPGGLWILGEPGYSVIEVVAPWCGAPLEERLKIVRGLFPEAE